MREKEKKKRGKTKRMKEKFLKKKIVKEKHEIVYFGRKVIHCFLFFCLRML